MATIGGAEVTAERADTDAHSAVVVSKLNVKAGICTSILSNDSNWLNISFL